MKYIKKPVVVEAEVLIEFSNEDLVLCLFHAVKTDIVEARVNPRLYPAFLKEDPKGWRRGEASERMVRNVLEDLKLEKAIVDYRSANNKEDSQGIDFWVTLPQSMMPLQVKSTSEKATAHRKKYGKSIPVVVVKGDVRQRVLDAIEEFQSNYELVGD